MPVRGWRIDCSPRIGSRRSRAGTSRCYASSPLRSTRSQRSRSPLSPPPRMQFFPPRFGHSPLSETTRALAWIIGIAVVVRGLFAVGAWLVTKDVTVFHVPDTPSYIAPARELLAHGTFTHDGEPELARTPG